MSGELCCKRCGKSYDELAHNSALKAMGLNFNGLFDECPDSPTAKHEFERRGEDGEKS